MTDNGLAALAAALHHYRGTCELWTISEAACPIDHRVDAGAILGEHGVFLPEGLGPVMVGMAKEIAALRAALDGLVKAAEGSLVASGGHMDSGWNDVIGATQSWHDCLPNASALRAALAKAKGTP